MLRQPLAADHQQGCERHLTQALPCLTDAERHAPSFSLLLGSASLQGFASGQKLDKMGMRGSDTSELHFENCEVPAENVLGGVNQVSTRRRPAGQAMSGGEPAALALCPWPISLRACIRACTTLCPAS